jgi:hypothetical protein
MVPYSFIVDWFIPVGDVLSAASAELVYNDTNYEFGTITYSVKYKSEGKDAFPHSVYYRWTEDTPPDLNSFYWLEHNSPSDKTLIKRLIDAGALILG